MSADCLFCKIIAGELPSSKVFEDAEFFAFRDIAPAEPTHILIVPKLHFPAINKALPEQDEMIGRLLRRAAEIAAAEKLDDGFRLVINTGEHAGQTVFHLHLHILGGRQMRSLG